MTTTRLFQSTDSGAPTLTGQVDSLINLLKACLVGTAGVAYGSGPSAKAAAGWTNPYDDPTNHITVFRNDPSVGSGCYLRVLDDGSGTSATAAHAHMAAYATMSAVSTGTEPTPAAVTGWPGARIEKSTGANATAMPWVVVADERTVYFATLTTTAGRSVVYGAGDYESFVPGFASAIFCAGGRANTAAADRASAFCVPTSGIESTSGLVSLMRDYTGSTGVVTRNPIGPRTAASPSCFGSSEYPSYSAALSNATLSFPALIGSAVGIMGRFRGLYLPGVNVTGNTFPSTIAGTDPGSSLIQLRIGSVFGNAGANFNGGVLIETALPWQ